MWRNTCLINSIKVISLWQDQGHSIQTQGHILRLHPTNEKNASRQLRVQNKQFCMSALQHTLLVRIGVRGDEGADGRVGNTGHGRHAACYPQYPETWQAYLWGQQRDKGPGSWAGNPGLGTHHRRAWQYSGTPLLPPPYNKNSPKKRGGPWREVHLQENLMRHVSEKTLLGRKGWGGG